jgi:Mg-chelatase subunit ChlD
VPESNFTEGLYALQGLVERFKPDAHFAAILFSTKAEVMFTFLPAKRAMTEVVEIKYNGGYTNTQAALKKSGRLFVSKSSGGRSNAYKKMFILTDGQSNVKKENTLYLAYLLKEIGIEVYVMAVGEHIEGINELAMLATSTNKHLYRVGEMDQFMQVVEAISKDPSYENDFQRA